MAAVKITIELDDELVEDMRDLGILEDDVLSELLRSEVERRAMNLVNAEIQAYRKEKRGRDRNTPMPPNDPRGS